MQVTGACHCGDVTWQATLDPGQVGICHCNDCQILGSSAFQWAARIAQDDFILKTGSLKTYVKYAESGNPRAMRFCPRCATLILGGNIDHTGPLSLRLGGCDQRSELTPQFQIWCDSKQAWAQAEADIKIAAQQGLSVR